MLAMLTEWKLADAKLVRELKFKDFNQAFAFMTGVAAEAERINHHPDWSNVYNRVTISLQTHETGGITDHDIELAQAIDKTASQYQT